MEDILAGYEATCIQVAQANIELKPLKKFRKNDNIYSTRRSFRKRDYMSQSKSFYQIPLKTDAMKGFDNGVKIMDDKAPTFDGYGVLH